MTKFRTKALILREQSIGEKDKIVTAFSFERGIFRAFAKGAKNIKSQNCAGTQMFTLSRLYVHENKGGFLITEAKAEKTFLGVRNSLEGMALSEYFSELTLSLVPFEEPHDDVLKLLLNSLYLISKGEKDLLIIKSVFEMRLMSLLGYMPNLVMCPKCGKYESEVMNFIPQSGELYCSTCTNIGIPLNKGTYTALRHIIYSEDNKIFAFTLPKESICKLSTASESYILQKTEREIKTLAFFKGLCT
ncbi:MAG: DNA repair protein RecO [Acutalibacteraceae bacterium]